MAYKYLNSRMINNKSMTKDSNRKNKPNKI